MFLLLLLQLLLHGRFDTSFFEQGMLVVVFGLGWASELGGRGKECVSRRAAEPTEMKRWPERKQDKNQPSSTCP